LQSTEKTGFVHRDIAARNVLVEVVPNPDGSSKITKVKLCDLGLFREYNNAAERTYDTAKDHGPPGQGAPETFLRNGRTIRTYSEKSDVWQFGLFLWEMFNLATEAAWEGFTNKEAVDEVMKGNRLPKPVLCPDDVWKLIERCWAQEAKDRPTFVQVQQELEALSKTVKPWDISEYKSNLRTGGKSLNLMAKPRGSSDYVHYDDPKAVPEGAEQFYQPLIDVPYGEEPTLVDTPYGGEE